MHTVRLQQWTQQVSLTNQSPRSCTTDCMFSNQQHSKLTSGLDDSFVACDQIAVLGDVRCGDGLEAVSIVAPVQLQLASHCENVNRHRTCNRYAALWIIQNTRHGRSELKVLLWEHLCCINVFAWSPNRRKVFCMCGTRSLYLSTERARNFFAALHYHIGREPRHALCQRLLFRDEHPVTQEQPHRPGTLCQTKNTGSMQTRTNIRLREKVVMQHLQPPSGQSRHHALPR
jgi:hypothetical protein